MHLPCSFVKLKLAAAASLKLSALLWHFCRSSFVTSRPTRKCHKGKMVPLQFAPSHLIFLGCSSCHCFGVAVTMRGPLRRIALIGIAICFPPYVLSQACVATSQNPYCDPSFANIICCPAPNVCYWVNRQGTPGCCAQGQVCGVGGGISITTQPGTITATPSTQPTSTTTVLGGVVGTVTSGAVGVFSTVVRRGLTLRPLA